MTPAIVTVLSFLVTVGVLVVIHELGHYAAARFVGVKILRFSVGFGRTLWVRRLGRDQTEWAIAAIPLGGFVKMLDEREGDVPVRERDRAFNRQAVWARIFIVLAGPAANFMLALVVYWALFIAGLPGVKPVLGDPPRDSPAAFAGLSNGDTVRSVAEEPVYTWTDVRWLLLKEAVRRGTTPIEVETRGGGRSTRNLDMSVISKEDLDRDFLGKLGLRPFRPKVAADLGRVRPGSAAERGGLRQGDRVISVDGKPIATWFDFTTEVSGSAGRVLAIEVEREGRRLVVRATPDAVGEGASRIGRLGVEPGEALKREYERMTTTVRYGPAEAVWRAAHKVWDLSIFSVKMLGRMLVGDVSWKNLSGPITIADYAGQSAQLGWITWLGFLALVSVSLGVLNLLPIPLLDGGHLVYYFAEIVKGSPVSERTMEIGQRLGLALLLGLTFFAFYNDLNRLFTG
ncbi:MAG TPA: RIP metalloprotease RseP [Usitatibacter sp.]|nr:RIP metalloprotease RseP [Usitatibacter sp.]